MKAEPLNYRARFSSWHILARVLFVVFLVESGLMFLLWLSPWKFSPGVTAVLDASLLALFSSPFLYLLVIKPFRDEALSESAKFSNLVDSAPDAVIGVNRDGRIQFANKQAEAMFGFLPDELNGKPIDILVPSEKVETHPQNRRDYLANPVTRQMGLGKDVQAMRKDGSLFPAGVSLSYLHLHDGPLVLSVVRDMTVQRETRYTLIETNRKLRVGMEELQSRTRELDRLNEMSEMLQACMDVREASSLISQFAGLLFPKESGTVYLINPSRDMMEPATGWGECTFATSTFTPDSCWALRRGRIHTFEPGAGSPSCLHVGPKNIHSYLCVPMLAQGDSLGVLHIRKSPRVSAGIDGQTALWTKAERRIAVAMSDHIGLAFANLRLRDTLRNQSIHDPLTGMYNRRFVEEWLRKELSRATRTKEPLSIVMFDLDHFKSFNDTFGHEGGDLILRAIGDFLPSQIRSGDIASRLGGEEFAILLPGSTTEAAATRTEAIRQGVQHLLVKQGSQPLGRVTFSAGISTFPIHGDSADQLLRAADQALYQAKAAGRNRFAVASG